MRLNSIVSEMFSVIINKILIFTCININWDKNEFYDYKRVYYHFTVVSACTVKECQR